tara:strand:+ start:622 stop:771 length:150 start_codon:yes stop_codon:yes gene_type:complete
MNGKGDKRRPMAVDRETFDERWDRIFNNKNKKTKKFQKGLVVKRLEKKQ